MEYIWDIVLKAKEDGFFKSDLFWKQSKDISPYYEQSFSALNQNHVEESTIEINALYRFEELFSKYLHKGYSENPEFKKYFFDLVVHYLCEIDLGKGITKETIYLAELEQDIRNGVFGEVKATDFKSFNKNDSILPLLLKQMRIGATLTGFREAVTRFYPDCLIYQMKDNPKKILVYLGMKKTEKEMQKYDFIETMFLPIEYIVKVFWDKHFGIFGVDATLTMNEIELI